MEQFKFQRCFYCLADSSVYWHKLDEDSIWCHACFLLNQDKGEKAPPTKAQKSGNGKRLLGKNDAKSLTRTDSYPNKLSKLDSIRKSNRVSSKTPKAALFFKNGSSLSTLSKSKSRRTLLLKSQEPRPSPHQHPSSVTKTFIFYKGFYYQQGDVVAITDAEDGMDYYARIGSFLQDEYCQKFAYLQWLMPCVPTLSFAFTASEYILGPIEATPRDMSTLKFVCHAPMNAFDRTAPNSTITNLEAGFIMSSLTGKRRMLVTRDSIFSGHRYM